MKAYGLLFLCGFLSGAIGIWLFPSEQNEVLDVFLEQEEKLLGDIQEQEDINEIKNLQRSYGYYTDKKLWTQVADLFSEEATVEFSQRGLVIGKERIHSFLTVFSEEGIQAGVLANHLQLQPVLDIAEDGVSAKGRWRVLQMNGVYQTSANWGGGIYENEYIKEEGIWKISKLRVYNSFYLDYKTGWLSKAYPHAGINENFEPDLPPTQNYPIFPEVFIAPFHYDNPVTGNPL